MRSCIHFISQMLFIADDRWHDVRTRRRIVGLDTVQRRNALSSDNKQIPRDRFFFADLEEKQQPCFPYVHCSSVIVQRKSASFFLWCPSPLAISFAMHQHDLVEMKRSSQGNNVSNRAGFTYHCA